MKPHPICVCTDPAAVHRAAGTGACARKGCDCQRYAPSRRGNKRHARRCCPVCATRLTDTRQDGAPRPYWVCPAHGHVAHGSYPSGLEADRAMQLKALARAGEISDLKQQQVFEVQPESCEIINWRVDFTYTEHQRRIAEEAKGIADESYSIKAKLFRWKYRGKIELRVSRSAGRGRIVVEKAA